MNLTGHNIGRYHILEKLGEGGMAMVYKAYDTHLEHEVAVKVIRLDNLPRNAEERALKRFEREAKAVAKLDHPNIVKVTDYGDHEGSPYLVMPYLPGGTLKQYLKDHGRVDWREAARLLIPVAQALAYAHEQGLIHRDVKPSNILLSAKGWQMLTDFGVAKVVDDEMTQDLTGTSATVGTPEYMAPEQVMSKSVDHRADIYALGVVYYEMVTGRRPYEADTPMAVLVKHASAPLPRPRDLLPGLPDGVERVLLKALAKQPVDRYQDMSAFAAALEAQLQALPQEVPAERNSPPHPGRGEADQYVTIEQGAPPIPFQKVTASRKPEEPKKPVAWGKAMAYAAGGVVLVLLVVALTSGWFNPRLASPAPTELPVITETVVPTLTALAPTATNQPAKATDVLPTPIVSYTIGSTRVSEIDGMNMVYVPAGEFLMGSPEGEGDDDEHPQHTVYLDAYWIDQTEVTNAMYDRCVNDGYCTRIARSNSYTRDNYYGYPNYTDYPVLWVKWEQAKTYCEWVGRQLPTEAQWEKAARGEDGRTYPWGEELPNCSIANYFGKDDSCIRDTTSVGSYPAGISPYGALDMAGNVWEWVADWYDANYYQNSPTRNPEGPGDGEYRVLRGSSWLSGVNKFHSAFRDWMSPSDLSYHDAIGFRCALPLP